MREQETLKPLPLLRETEVLSRAQSYLRKCWQMVKLLDVTTAGYREENGIRWMWLWPLSLIKGWGEQQKSLARGEGEFLGYLLCKTNLFCLLVYNISLLFLFVKNTDQTSGLEVNSDVSIGFTQHLKFHRCLPRTYLTRTMQFRQRAQVTKYHIVINLGHNKKKKKSEISFL